MLDNEDLIVLPKAAAWIAERTGRRPNISTLHRWATRGVRGVVLETVAVGHVRYTSVEAVRRFLHAKPAEQPAVSEVRVSPDHAAKVRGPRRSRVDEFERRLFRGGRGPGERIAKPETSAPTGDR